MGLYSSWAADAAGYFSKHHNNQATFLKMFCFFFVSWKTVWQAKVVPAHQSIEDTGRHAGAAAVCRTALRMHLFRCSGKL